MVDVFAGETVHDVKIKCSDLDSNGSPALVFGVGDGADTDYYIAGQLQDKTVLLMSKITMYVLKSTQQTTRLMLSVK